jgi:Lipase (class 3)
MHACTGTRHARSVRWLQVHGGAAVQVVVTFRGTEASRVQDIGVDALFRPMSIPVRAEDVSKLGSVALQRLVRAAQVCSNPPSREMFKPCFTSVAAQLCGSSSQHELLTAAARHDAALHACGAAQSSASCLRRRGLKRAWLQVHRGFMEAWYSVIAQVSDLVRACTHGSCNWSIVCNGHSLGGALATVTAFDFAVRRCAGLKRPQRASLLSRVNSLMGVATPAA